MRRATAIRSAASSDDEERLVRRAPIRAEDVYKIYAESFIGPEHLKRLQTEAQALIGEALAEAEALLLQCGLCTVCIRGSAECPMVARQVRAFRLTYRQCTFGSSSPLAYRPTIASNDSGAILEALPEQPNAS